MLEIDTRSRAGDRSMKRLDVATHPSATPNFPLATRDKGLAPAHTPNDRLNITQLCGQIAEHRAAHGARARVAFVLHPGGAAGAYQAGALAALAEAGLSPDLIIGTSIGAFNGLGFWLDELAGRTPGKPAFATHLGRLWRLLGHRAQGSHRLLDKPFLLGWITGRPDWRHGMAGDLAGQLFAVGEACAALRQGIFTTARLEVFTRHVVASALGLPRQANSEQVGRALFDASLRVSATGHPVPDLVVVATDVGAHAPCAFVLGAATTAHALRARGWEAYALGEGSLAGAAVLEAFYASASIPAVFPSSSLVLSPGSAPRTLVDGVVGNHRPFQMAVDAGATLIVSLEVESAEPGQAYAMPAEAHFVAAAAEAFMTIGDNFVRDSASELALVNRALARSTNTRALVVPLYRLAPRRRLLGLLDFDGRYVDGKCVTSLYDGFMAGYADAGGDAASTWRDYVLGHAVHGDTGTITPTHGESAFRDATLHPVGTFPVLARPERAWLAADAPGQ
jgi:predicted acylesterase/phospholipase RssA